MKKIMTAITRLFSNRYDRGYKTGHKAGYAVGWETGYLTASRQHTELYLAMCEKYDEQLANARKGIFAHTSPVTAEAKMNLQRSLMQQEENLVKVEGRANG